MTATCPSSSVDDAENLLNEFVALARIMMGRLGLTVFHLEHEGEVAAHIEDGAKEYRQVAEKPLSEELNLTKACNMVAARFLGGPFSEALTAAMERCRKAHEAGKSMTLPKAGFMDASVRPGKKFPTKCYIQHSRENLEIAYKLARLMSKSSDYGNELHRRLTCIDGYGREYADPSQARDECNKKDFVCIEHRS